MMTKEQRLEKEKKEKEKVDNKIRNIEELRKKNNLPPLQFGSEPKHSIIAKGGNRFKEGPIKI